MAKDQKKPYLADVQVGDKLYNFLENREYIVTDVLEDDETQFPIGVKPIHETAPNPIKTWISLKGTPLPREVVPYYLYQPVEILDPNNLPPRPWKPKKGEWVWAKITDINYDRGQTSWILVRFMEKYEDSQRNTRIVIKDQFGERQSFHYDAIKLVPFKGNLPPGLKDEVRKEEYRNG